MDKNIVDLILGIVASASATFAAWSSSRNGRKLKEVTNNAPAVSVKTCPRCKTEFFSK